MKIITIILVALACANAASVNGQPKSTRQTVTIGGVEYVIEETEKTWREADSGCAELEMKLVTLETEEKDIEIGHWLTDHDLGDLNMWTAGKKSLDGFVWGIDGEPFEYERWYAGEPDDTSFDVCVLFQGRHGWHDYSCDYSFAYMCQPM